GRRRYRSDQVSEVWLQPARREIGGGDGGMRPTLRAGIQPEQADERVGRATEGRAGWVIGCGQRGCSPEGHVPNARSKQRLAATTIPRNPARNYRASSRLAICGVELAAQGVQLGAE